MTNEEAIIDIRENIQPIIGGKSLDIAISALEKQIPKKVNISLKGTTGWKQNAIVLIAIVWFCTGNIVLIADRLWILTVMGVTLNETQILQKMRLLR